ACGARLATRPRTAARDLPPPESHLLRALRNPVLPAVVQGLGRELEAVIGLHLDLAAERGPLRFGLAEALVGADGRGMGLGLGEVVEGRLHPPKPQALLILPLGRLRLHQEALLPFPKDAEDEPG